MTYALAIAFVRWLLKRFFRRVEVSGLEHLPPEGGGLVVSWHPNGLIDPALILTHLPRHVVFGARHGLFRWPILGQLMRALGTVPIYRAHDRAGISDEERRERNRQSLDALADKIAGGSYSALFPEGVSHDDPNLQELKVGAARLYVRAVEQASARGAPAPVIVPVGLHYDQKDAWRSQALVAFHPPLNLPRELVSGALDAAALVSSSAGEESCAAAGDGALERAAAGAEEAYRERCTRLMEAIHAALVVSVKPTESWEVHRLMHRVRTLVRAERARRAGASPRAPDMHERTLGFARVWSGYEERRVSQPEETAALMERVRTYDADLEALRLEDHELDAMPKHARPLNTALLVGQVIGLYVLLPPLLVLGLLINGPPWLFLRWISGKTAKLDKDKATIKWLGGVLLFPLVWGAIGAMTYFGWLNLHAAFPEVLTRTPGAAAVVTLFLSAIGGAFALRYARLTRATLHGLRVGLTRRQYRATIERLRDERAEITDVMDAMAEGLALPGHVQHDGRVGPGGDQR